MTFSQAKTNIASWNDLRIEIKDRNGKLAKQGINLSSKTNLKIEWVAVERLFFKGALRRSKARDEGCRCRGPAAGDEQLIVSLIEALEVDRILMVLMIASFEPMY